MRRAYFRPELSCPLSDRLIRHPDPTLEQQFLDVPQAQGKPVVQPHRMSDDGSRKSMAFVTNGRNIHPTAITSETDDETLT